MTDPTTSNLLLAVPTRGSDSGTWDVPVNANSTALDGLLGGVQTISVTDTDVTLTAPTGTVTPSGGPYQSQNKILKFTGALTANVAITLPLPGEYTIQNLTTGAYVLSFKAGSGNIVATPQGSVMHIWNDGTDVWLVKNQVPGALTFLGGISAVPAWISACTIAPYLLCDGSVYNISAYSALGNLYGSTFGGNGGTTFGVQDLRGRVPLAYDGTGSRITTAGCGIDGQTIGAAGGAQDTTLLRSDLPNVAPTFTGSSSTVAGIGSNLVANAAAIGNPGGSGYYAGSTFQNPGTLTVTPLGTVQSINGNVSQTSPSNVPPAQVSGIWIVAT